MAIAQLQVAPVITPRTLEELARILHEDKRDDLVSMLLELKPLVSDVVGNLFRPITEVRTRPKFWPAFYKYSRDFEPYRLYINLKLVELLGSENFFESYKAIFAEITEMLLKSAEQKGISALRLREVLHAYLNSCANLLHSLSTLGETGESAKVEEINLADWLRSATRLDYSLTALFLILEDEIPLPPKRICELLLVASEKSLSEFESHNAMLVGALSSASVAKDRARETRGIRNRALELDWLRSQAASITDLSGKWIVVEGDQLVASDTNYEQARTVAAHKGVRRPFIIYIPSSSEEAFMGI